MRATTGPPADAGRSVSSAQPGHAVQENAHQFGLAAHAGLGKNRAQMRARGVALDVQHFGSFFERQTVGQLNNWLSNRYFFDGRLEDFSARPERIKAITRERIIDTARDFFAANCWGLGLYGNTEKAVAERLNEKLEKLF